jgi:hypothetical protein
LECVQPRPQIRLVLLACDYSLAELLGVPSALGDRRPQAELNPSPKAGQKSIKRILS